MPCRYRFAILPAVVVNLFDHTYLYIIHVCMKTKLTLTIRKSVIITAKRYARKTGKSISRIFEEFVENVESSGSTKSESQKAAERLLKNLESSKPVETLDDKKLLKHHVARKFA